MRRAQSSMEFMMYVGIAFVFALGMAIVVIDQVNQKAQEEQDAAVKDLATALKIEFEAASNVQDGFERTIEIPDFLLFTLNYSIIKQNQTITVESEKSFYTVRIPQVIGNITKGTNSITKTDGTVYLNP